MTLLIYLAIYTSVLAFVLRSIARAVTYASAPAHLRWELYPVPHEAPQRAGHGGSYFEETDWWKKKSETNLMGELRVMLPEMLFLKGLWEFNRALWFRSFPFHFGLYLCLAALSLLLSRAVASLLAPAMAAGTLGSLWGAAYQATGVTGAVLVVAGSLGLLLRRLRDPELRPYSTPADLFNLAFFALTFASLLASYALRPAGALTALGFLRGLLTFDTSLAVPPPLAAVSILGFLLAAYIPFTHMSHFIAKYFTYHSIRWDDVPLARRKGLEAKVAQYLTYRPSWGAVHIGADGVRTWAEIATAAPVEAGKKDGKEGVKGGSR